MFHDLVEMTPVPTQFMITQEVFHALMQSLPDKAPEMVHRQAHLQTKRELRALISAIETYGLSQALLAFSNHNGVLKRAIPSLPALESLTPDLATSVTPQLLNELKTLEAAVDVAEEKLREGFNGPSR